VNSSFFIVTLILFILTIAFGCAWLSAGNQIHKMEIKPIAKIQPKVVLPFYQKVISGVLAIVITIIQIVLYISFTPSFVYSSASSTLSFTTLFLVFIYYGLIGGYFKKEISYRECFGLSLITFLGSFIGLIAFYVPLIISEKITNGKTSKTAKIIFGIFSIVVVGLVFALL
jgi:hypothetical protein